jgi:hypothetical protein
MPEVVGVKLVEVLGLAGGGYIVTTTYRDGFLQQKAVHSVAQMKKRLKVAIEELIEDNTVKAKP